jgi:hypothetical protein
LVLSIHPKWHAIHQSARKRSAFTTSPFRFCTENKLPPPALPPLFWPRTPPCQPKSSSRHFPARHASHDCYYWSWRLTGCDLHIAIFFIFFAAPSVSHFGKTRRVCYHVLGIALQKKKKKKKKRRFVNKRLSSRIEGNDHDIFP